LVEAPQVQRVVEQVPPVEEEKEPAQPMEDIVGEAEEQVVEQQQ
jgi:hypothetical protein